MFHITLYIIIKIKWIDVCETKSVQMKSVHEHYVHMACEMHSIMISTTQFISINKNQFYIDRQLPT